MIERVSRVISIDISEFEIEMKFKLKTFNLIPPIPIMTNDDVDYFLKETISGAKLKIPRVPMKILDCRRVSIRIPDYNCISIKVSDCSCVCI